MSIADRSYFNLDKKHDEDRMKIYSIPGVQEVIYSDEWVPRPYRNLIKLTWYQKLINKLWVSYIKIRRWF